MDFDEKITLSSNGESIELPLVNVLRIAMVKMQPLLLEFQQETGKSDLVSFNKWMSDKLGMTGKLTLV